MGFYVFIEHHPVITLGRVCVCVYVCVYICMKVCQ